jgi:hypothetical protein
MSDSLIRLRQLNQTELSGYISRVLLPALRASGYNITGANRDLLPTSSGAQDLGSSSFPFDSVFTNQVQVPSGSGIWFGTTFLTAYTSGSTAVISVGSYQITSNPTGLSIVGPSGSIGITGPSGATGVSGIGITGISGVGTTGITLLLSNGTRTNNILLPSGLTGVRGVSLTGLYSSGGYIFPQFSNGTTGTGIPLPTGIQGARGMAGGITLGIYDFTGLLAGQILPKAYIYDIDPLGASYNPTINLVKGMTYDFNYTGLSLTGVTIGLTTYKTNYFVVNSSTGYLKFAFFDPSVTDLYSNPYSGRYVKGEIGGAVYSDIYAKVADGDTIYNVEENANRGEQVFTLKYSASSPLKWGFQRFNFTTMDPMDDTSEWGFYVLGDVLSDYFGPSGASGQQGPAGIPGAQGERGPRGLNGSAGTSITGIERDGNDVRFLFSNGSVSDWTTLPAGGPTGPSGPAGAAGPSGAQGPQGLPGATGFADRYSATFLYSDTSINGTGQAFNKRPSGTSTWVLCQNNNRKFSPGDEVSFYNDALKGKAYTTWQKLLFADTPYDRYQYFYATVSDYNSTNGLLNFVVSDTPSPLGMVGNEVLWHQYNEVDVNLGGLGSSGAQGPIGPAGPRGDTGNSVFVINHPTSGIRTGNNLIHTNQYDGFDLHITGLNNIVLFDYNTFATGQTILLRIANSGVGTNNDILPLITWGTGEIKFPYGVQAPGPEPNTACMYTLVRYPDAPFIRVFCTYSMQYSL